MTPRKGHADRQFAYVAWFASGRSLLACLYSTRLCGCEDTAALHDRDSWRLQQSHRLVSSHSMDVRGNAHDSHRLPHRSGHTDTINSDTAVSRVVPTACDVSAKFKTRPACWVPHSTFHFISRDVTEMQKTLLKNQARFIRHKLLQEATLIAKSRAECQQHERRPQMLR